MDYYENCCQICGVSFNLARYRTKYEAAEAGWGYSNGLYYSGDTSSCLETDEEGRCEDITVNGVEDVHIAGLGCIFNGGYSGHRISVEEMKNMRLSRYIIKKPRNTPEEKDAADYEKCSDFFITDQTTTTQNYEPGNLPRDRYGVDSFFPQNYLVITDEGEFFGVPVHDACWKIFERVSKLRLGRVDLQGFMALWYRSACGTCSFQTIKQERIVNECKQQFWSHVPGTEYLAANPHDIVGLSRMALGSYH
ncbi:hypothetical protein EAF04_004340 [Stromatinia cepivora]|nr:hypothetical protein EAF04_004340 [Stromatinia cepivora]